MSNTIGLQLKTLSALYKMRDTDIKDAGFRIFSQDNEDGLLHYIFSRIGTTNKVCAEVSFANPEGSNVTNLIVNDGWLGILNCAKQVEVKAVNKYFAGNRDVLYKPVVYQNWITAENINGVIEKGLAELYAGSDLDLLSIDIDGMDYWVWKALEFQPRVVVIEYDNALGNRSVTIPYKADFNRFDIDPEYRSASLPTLAKLGKAKGYKLVACSRLNLNAIFVRNDVSGSFGELPIEQGLNHPFTKKRITELSHKLYSFEWQEV